MTDSAILRKIRPILRALIVLHIYPNLYLPPNPFKILEFRDVLRHVTFSVDDVVLDLGCGFGWQTMWFARRCRKAIGIDTSCEDIRCAQYLSRYTHETRTGFYCTTIEDAPFEKNYFSKIFSICVLEHVHSPESVLHTSYQILKEGGEMLLSVDALESVEDPALIQKHQKDHLVEHYWTQQKLRFLLEGTGFRDITIYPLFRSQYASRLFMEGIRRRFRFGLFQTIVATLHLVYAEKGAVGERGLFLVAVCKK